MMRAARIAVLGLGRIGSLHARNLAGVARAGELACVVDAIPARARGVGEELGVPWHTVAEPALADPRVDGVVIATPSTTHAALIELAAAHGKHILCEKPISLDAASTRRALVAVNDAGVRLQIGFQRRFDPDLVEIRDAIRAGRIGEPRCFRSTHRNARRPVVEGADSLGGLFADVALHDFDLARWLFGEVELVAAMATDACGGPTGRESEAAQAVILMRLASGVLGVVDASRAAGYGFEASLEVVGSDATVRVGGTLRATPIEWLGAGRVEASLVQDHASWHRVAYVRELEHFASVATGGEPPSVGGDDGEAAFAIAAAASDALCTGRPVEVANESIASGLR